MKALSMFNSPVPGLSPELFWLTVAALLTGLMWLPYVLNRIMEYGPWPAMGNPDPGRPTKAAWAVRMAAAHRNAVENLVIFAPLVLVAVIAQRTGPMTAAAAGIYVIARLIHFVVYAAGIPVLRTLAFAAGFASCAAIAIAILT
jgi:uncharacterized MAPEG superfamily protein